MTQINVKNIKTRTAETAMDLPPGIQASDTKYPKYNWKNAKKKRDNVVSTLTFYKTERGWVVTTLHIARARQSGTSDRSYAVSLDGGVCRVGRGPHVLAEVTVYVKESRREALKKFIELHEKGLAAAGDIRDRISSRRAEGQLRRSHGEHNWLWDN